MTPKDRAWESASRDGFYHGGGIADELVALSSLFLRRRFELGPMVRMDDKPILFPIQKRIDPEIIAGESNIGYIDTYLKLTENLKSEYHQRFILAVRLYHRALLIIEEQPDIAYLNLVSSIETLCQDYPIELPTLSDHDGRLSKLLDSIEDKTLKQRIEDAILKKEHFIGRRFVAFILGHLEESFWESRRPEHGQIKPEDLPELLKRIYKQRSLTLHTGEPFPPSIFELPMGAEIDFSLGMTAGQKKWERKDYIPYPHFFERLVNHVLMSFLKKNSHR